MKRRGMLLGGLGAAVLGTAALLRPQDEGAPHDPYFRRLNDLLKRQGPMRPCLVIDLDRLDHNLDTVLASVRRQPGRQYRIVEKSLPSPGLLDYVMRRAGSRRLMSFHQPFLNQDAVEFPDADLLLGKPLPVQSAERFLQAHRGPFDPSRQLQWLVDTPQRIAQYLSLARGQGLQCRLNIELDVGLHRGGVDDPAVLAVMLQMIEAHPEHLSFAGFMGYDAHVGLGMPLLLGSPEALLMQSMNRYAAAIEQLRRDHPGLWRHDLTLNSAGSTTYQLHEAETLCNDLSVGSALLLPAHFDRPTLVGHRPAVWIATPVLKAIGTMRYPELDNGSRLLSWWDVNQRKTYFLYGGHWMARHESPRGLRENRIYGRSSNQEVANASVSAGLTVDDQVFLRPLQSESLLLQFGDLLAVRGDQIEAVWPVFSA